ncbi:MAG: SRPBCC domain-containing protein [Kibdelosporangium sp.]
MRRDLSFDTELPYAPPVVWLALTDPVAISEWLMPIEGFAPVVGAKFTLRGKPMPGWDGVIEGRILEVEEHRLLSYTWKGTKMRGDTTVRWTLRPLADGAGTHLRLDHRGFEGFGGTLMSFMHRGGWQKFLHRTLPAYLAHHEAGSEA